MEDDDEFGDLYTDDVLKPLTTSFQSQPQQQQQQQQPPAPPPPQFQRENKESSKPTAYQGRPIDLNVNRDKDDDDDDDDEDKFFRAANSSSTGKIQTLASSQSGFYSRPDPTNFDLNKISGQVEGSSGGLAGAGSDSQARVLGTKEGDAKLPERARGSSGLGDDADIDVMVEERDEKDDNFVVKGGNLTDRSGNVENFGTGDPMIPGLSIPGVSGRVESRANANYDDDWDSDSEDDLQIVLNDTNHGPMGMERMGGGGGGMGDEDDDDEDDEDGEPLVIVADNDDPSHQPMMMEEQDWGGEEVGAGGDGEKKELGEAAKINGAGGGAVAAQKIGYSGHGYHHPFHSQFKYVRPGASPMPGAAAMGPGGTSGQVRPPVSMVPGAGRGRGDWRPTGVKGPPAMQKGFHPGYGMPIWGSGASGRGLEFTLPSHKTIFEVDIDGFEEKPWRHAGVDITDFFNFGLIEESWKDYCKQLEQLRLETTMQSKIRVYESGRTEQEYDPDLPPELAAAAGIQDTPSESLKVGKPDAVQNDLGRVHARVRPPVPTGRAIQVETGYGERLPSIDTRKPRISDLDVIIEIVCQDPADDDTNTGNEMTEQADNDPSREDLRDGDEFEDLPKEDTEDVDRVPHAHSSRRREVVGGRVPISKSVHDNLAEGNGDLPLSSEAPSASHPDSREQTPVYPGRDFAHEERRTKERARDSSPMIANKDCTAEERITDNKESSVESLEGKHSLPSSPLAVRGASEQNSEPKDAMNDEVALTEIGSDMIDKDASLNAKTSSDSLTDETGNHALKKQKVSSNDEQHLPQEIDEDEDSKAARSSENSKAKSGSSNYRKLRDSVEEEEVQGARSKHMGNLKRSTVGSEDSVRRKLRDDRQENDRHRTSVKGREDLYQHKGLDPYSAHPSRGKSVNIDLRKDMDSIEGARHRREEDLHGRRPRAEDTRKREHRDETDSRHRSKVREIERNEKDEHYQLRKQLDNGNWKGGYDKDVGLRHRDREDNVKSRNEIIDDLHNKRRKDDAQLRREHAEKEEMLHAQRESSSRRKRERDDVLDHRRRDDQVRMRDDDQHGVRYKEEGLFQRERGERQREREEWHRLKQLNEDIPSKKEKEDLRVGMRSGRATEEKTWGSQSRGKDDRRSSDKEYHSKDALRQSELISRRDRAENESLSQHRGREEYYAHGNQLNTDERRGARHERMNTRDDRAANVENYKVHERKHRENPRKGKETESVDRNSLARSRKNQDEISAQTSDMVRFKGRIEQGKSENEIHVNIPPSKKHREEASSDDEVSESRRGRSKLERWTSHKERDFSISSKASSSVKMKQPEAYGSGGPSIGSKLRDEASNPVEDKQHPSGNEKDAASLETNNTDKKPIEDRHLDTVEKLKKRSERFKLPMPSEKEATTVKKVENEALLSAQSESRADFEVKAERPARKRRWTGN
ncbi:FIP1[V]-like protein [Coffea arabica]|uniref:FIP1[V]-like protein n=1 Tax=Coffea arabica TaxID=13443 RepID=A0A6P6SI02_COFAR